MTDELDDLDPEPDAPKNLDGATEEELAAFGLRIALTSLCDRLHYAIEDGASAEDLHNVVDLWEVNLTDYWTLEGLANRARPLLCLDCRTDVMPFGQYGQRLEGQTEWYMVTEEVWKAANGPGSDGYLCIGCLETRLGRPLTPDDFPDLPVNESSWMNTPRLEALLTARADTD